MAELSDDRLREIAAYQPLDFAITHDELVGMANEIIVRRAAEAEPVEPVGEISEAQCHYCGDMSYAAHRCRAGSHDFRDTGRQLHLHEARPLYALAKATT